MTSPLHRLGAGPKLAGLAAAGTALLVAREPASLAAALGATAALYGLARIPARLALAQLRPAVPLLAALFALQGVTEGWEAAATTAARMAALIGLAALFSLTTGVAQATAALERGLAPLALLGLRPRAAALALTLAVRFLPLLAERARQVRDAQRARGLGRNPLALAVPLLVGSLKMAHDLAEAIEARGFDPEAP